MSLNGICKDYLRLKNEFSVFYVAPACPRPISPFAPGTVLNPFFPSLLKEDTKKSVPYP